VEVSNGKVSILTDDAELGSEIDKASAAAAVSELESRLRSEHDAEIAGELSKAHARLAAAGGVAGTAAGAH
jgi:F0F1-type ATP synthase epsilon subunit